MARRKCCCQGTTDNGNYCNQCVSPISPCTKQKHRIEVRCEVMLGVSSGSGMLTWGDPSLDAGQTNFPDQELNCMYGPCSPQFYGRKKIFVEDWLANDCNDMAIIFEQCEALSQVEQGPAVSGHHYVEWEGCEALLLGSNETFEDQSDCASIVAMYKDVPVNCIGTGTDQLTGCWTVVDVDYIYQDGFAARGWRHTGASPCAEVERTWIYPQQVWNCRYARKNGPNQAVAVGAYRLMSASCALFRTYWQRNVSGQTNCQRIVDVCASSWATAPVDTGTPWQPPPTIDVWRIC